ncbi:MAG: hypothetical protein JJE48_09430 [Actinobacteria bacterium]|nr:hypothetical protein [Actinomycetota bacterium]
MRTLETDELKELLVKCWMTHDGSWFYSCMREFGVEAANRLNKGANFSARVPLRWRRAPLLNKIRRATC